jgi:hypothetical protein
MLLNLTKAKNTDLTLAKLSVFKRPDRQADEIQVQNGKFQPKG